MWKDIQGYENLYEASNDGKVRRKNSNKELIGFVNKDGYIVLSLCKNGIVKKFRRNRLIAQTFIPNINNLPFVNHKDEIKTNDCVDNLEWCTRVYNCNYGTSIERSSKKKWKSVMRSDNNGDITIYSSLKQASI